MTKATKKVTVSLSNGVARIKLAHPPLNILTIQFLTEIQDTVNNLNYNGLKAIVFESELKIFSAGADIKEHLPSQVNEMLKTFHATIKSIARLPVPTVAALKGSALGGGLELALACDLIIASKEAKLGQPEIKVGVFPPVAMALLPHLIPFRKALELILTGEPIGAEEAYRIGLINQIAPLDEFDEALENFLQRLTDKSSSILQLTLKTMKQTYPLWNRLSEIEATYLNELMQLPDALEGLTAFLEKRKPKWTM